MNVQEALLIADRAKSGLRVSTVDITEALQTLARTHRGDQQDNDDRAREVAELLATCGKSALLGKS